MTTVVEQGNLIVNYKRRSRFSYAVSLLRWLCFGSQLKLEKKNLQDVPLDSELKEKPSALHFLSGLIIIFFHIYKTTFYFVFSDMFSSLVRLATILPRTLLDQSIQVIFCVHISQILAHIYFASSSHSITPFSIISGSSIASATSSEIPNANLHHDQGRESELAFESWNKVVSFLLSKHPSPKGIHSRICFQI